MTVTVFFADLRKGESVYRKAIIAWRDGLSARDVLELALNADAAQVIADDLAQDNRELIVSWGNPQTDDHSEIGGVGSVDWPIDDGSILTVTYEDSQTTALQINEHIEWILANS